MSIDVSLERWGPYVYVKTVSIKFNLCKEYEYSQLIFVEIGSVAG